MSSYTKATNFASKDALASGNPLKIVKGTEIDSEFNAIATAINSKIEGYNAVLTGTPTAPTPSVSTYTTQLASTAFVHDVLPKGVIMLWSGSTASIPFGWALCNGSSSTPDLRDRFVVGAGSTYAVAATGGTADAVVVSHTHTATSTVTDPGHVHNSMGNVGGSSTGISATDGDNALNYPTSSAVTGVTVATTVATTGVSGTNQNLPPYYALCYIMKTTGI